MRSLVVRPPEYFPSLATAALWVHADRIVVATHFAFSRQSTHNRARIRTATGAQWLSVPRTHAPVGTSLAAVGIVADGWARRHGHALRTAYGMAPFAEHYLPEIGALLARPYDALSDLGEATSAWTARHLGVADRLVRAGDLPGARGTLAEIRDAAGGGVLLARPESAARDAAQGGGEVRVVTLDAGAAYRQVFPGFVAGLSALDLLMNLGPSAADWLREHSAVGS